MAKRYCKICGAEWEENFDECWNCGMPADPDEQLWFDKDVRRRLERKRRIAKKKANKTDLEIKSGDFHTIDIGLCRGYKDHCPGRLFNQVRIGL